MIVKYVFTFKLIIIFNRNHCEEVDAKTIKIANDSRNKLGVLVMGLVMAVGDYFDEGIATDETIGHTI